MGDEELEENPFLVALRMRAPDLYTLAAKNQLVICCPRRAATGALSLNRTCFETHILQASPFFAGVFECLNSEKTVDLDGGVIETQRGFRERRKVKILNEELHYNGDYKPFRVLCISQVHVLVSYADVHMIHTLICVNVGAREHTCMLALVRR